ncbi:TraB/GumN family protein [Tritonibacter mobilis]|nr:TraB/GumN family protein [Tritonibacter mobilis]
MKYLRGRAALIERCGKALLELRARAFTVLIAAVLMASLTQAAAARCDGIDLRQHLTESARHKLDDALAKVPFAVGNHWVAIKGDQRINVIGTQHSGDARMLPIMRRLRPVIEQADAIFLEVTEPQMRAADTAQDSFAPYFLLPPGQRLDQMIPEAEWRLLMARLAPFGISSDATARMQPWYLSDFLTGTDCRKRGLGSRRGLDDRIEHVARTAGIPTFGLESPEAGLAALASMPLSDQVKMLRFDLRSETRHQDLYVTLSDSFFEGRLTEGRILLLWMMYRDLDVPRQEVHRLLASFDRVVLERRNRTWVKRLLARKEPHLVVAVGAAHLAGDTGVLNLLHRAGYALSPVDDR